MKRRQDLSIDTIHNPLQYLYRKIYHKLSCKSECHQPIKEIITLVLAYAVQPVDYRVIKL
jgi:hypothetical protein